MATPIFARAVNNYAGSWASDAVVVSLGGGVPALMMQGVAASFQQATRTLYSLNTPGRTNQMYLLGGRASGQAQIQRTIGESGLMSLFYATFGNICLVGTNNMEISTDSQRCDLGAGAPVIKYGYGLENVHIAGVSLNVAIDPVLVQESTQLNFANMSVPDPVSPSGPFT